MDSDPAAMLAVGRNLARQLLAWGVITPESDVLDIGCGYGRLAYGLLDQGFRGRYVGIDILRGHIDWLQAHLRPCLPPGADFYLLDIANGRYNPGGRMQAEAVQFPPIAAPGAVVLFSVFTHMVAEDIGHYLRAIAAILKPGITVCASFFLINDEMRALEAAGRSRYPLAHALSDVCAIMDPEEPLHVIGFAESWVRAQIAAHGMEVVALHPGTWCGRDKAGPFQDVVIFRRAG